MKVKFPGGNPLRFVCAVGFLLALLTGVGLVFSLLTRASQGSSVITFAAELRAYDFFDAPRRVLEGGNPAQIEERLSRLQELERNVGEQLSVLKRRRALAQIDRRYIAPYERAAREAAEAYPYSSPIAAVAAEALLLGDGIRTADIDLLLSYGSRVSQNRFGLLELGIDFFSGELEDPVRAAALPGIDGLLSGDYPGLPEQIRRDLLFDDFLLRAYRRDVSGASQRLEALLAGGSAPPEITRMGAEFYYDHNNPLKAAELFLALAGETDIVRAADSLFLAGEVSGARNIWFALASGTVSVDLVSRPAEIPVRMRSYYNLAATSASGEEELYWLQQSFAAGNYAAGNSVANYAAANSTVRTASRSPSELDSARLFTTLRYSRLLEDNTAVAILDDVREEPLLDLELLRREIDSLPFTRATAEVWLLLGRHPSSEPLHEWAAWYFDLKKLYSETDRLLLGADRRGMYGSWFDLHSGLALLRVGRTDEGEKVLREAAQANSPDWRIPANLGRIYESRGNISAALGYYESAAALISESRLLSESTISDGNLLSGGNLLSERAAVAQLQMRLSRCLETLGRMVDSRRAIEYAVELDPENIIIRRELRRISGL